MDPVETINEPPNDHYDDNPETTSGGPTLPRMILGARLRRLRESRGITLEAAGQTIRASHSKISRLELGRTGFKRRDVADLLELYGVSDPDELSTLLALAGQANAPLWWQPYGEVVPAWFEAYLGMEQAAGEIRGYEVQFVPGLLQTADYARAVAGLDAADVGDAVVDRRVELRMRRQEILRRSVPPRLGMVIDEAVLRRPIGGHNTMRGQLRHLLALSEESHIDIQVLPFSVGGHAAGGGPIAVLRFPGDELPDMVYLEQLISAHYPDKPADILYYRRVMDRLSAEARPAAETPGILREILERL
jgi:transcriptional regulator with XRE-family HTH domain